MLKWWEITWKTNLTHTIICQALTVPHDDWREWRDGGGGMRHPWRRRNRRRKPEAFSFFHHTQHHCHPGRPVTDCRLRPPGTYFKSFSPKLTLFHSLLLKPSGSRTEGRSFNIYLTYTVLWCLPSCSDVIQKTQLLVNFLLNHHLLIPCAVVISCRTGLDSPRRPVREMFEEVLLVEQRPAWTWCNSFSTKSVRKIH